LNVGGNRENKAKLIVSPAAPSIVTTNRLSVLLALDVGVISAVT